MQQDKRDFYTYTENKLNSLKSLGLHRSLRLASASGSCKSLDNLDANNYICFSSNDYLGLAQNKAIIEKTIKDIRLYGNGASGARLISGNIEYHTRLEKHLASFKQKDAALLFGSGYLANIALLSCLPSLKDLVLSDELNHASIIDGLRLSRASVITYPHCDMDFVQSYLKAHRHKFRYVFIVTDALFSMDGDIVPLPDLYRLCSLFDAIPILDEAHSTGVLGDNGSGIESHFKLQNDSSIIMGTLGKALGSYGAFVCGKLSLIDFLINKARSFIYSTALPPASCLSAYNGLCLIEEDKSIVYKLQYNIAYLQKGLKEKLGLLYPNNSPIFPIVLGKATMDTSKKLLDKGIYIQGIRPPTVAYGKSRLRLTISASHSALEIDYLVSNLESLAL